MQKHFGWFILILLGLSLKCEGVFNLVKLENNSYSGLLVAINPEVAEDSRIVEAIKDMITEASQVIFTATHRRAHFGHVTILVPKTWTNGNYDSAHGQSYNLADVIVASPNPMYGDDPYTLQYGQCGEPGSYIHFTPNYLTDDTFITDYGPRGKTFVHEWGHLRWGVFDEAPTDGTDAFYFDNSQQVQATRQVTVFPSNAMRYYNTDSSATASANIESNFLLLIEVQIYISVLPGFDVTIRCPIGLSGSKVFYTSDNPVAYRTCQSSRNGLPEDGCVFVPDQTQNVNVSLMSHQYIDQVVEFCDDADPNSSTNNNNAHNTEAPNEQNRLCGMRSIWSVMRSSVDFNGTNFPNDAITDVTPTFTVARARPYEKFVLVLDVSGSMAGTKIEDMQVAANLFITQFLPNGTQVGIVEFSYTATILQNLVLIDNNRQYLTDIIGNLIAGGGTCIGCGIFDGITVLESDGEPAAGGNLIVLTDGEENQSPMVSDTREEVLEKGVVVDSIFFGVTTANQDLQDLCVDTQGVWFFNDDLDSGALIQTFKQLSNLNDGDVYNEIFQIYGQSFSVPANEILNASVFVDSTIGNNTVFTFSYSSYDSPHVFLYSPSGDTFCSAVPPANCVMYATVDTQFKTIVFQVPGTAEVGSWVFSIITYQYSSDVDVIVTSMAANREVPPMVVQSGMSQTDSSNLQPIVVYAMVSINYAPVLGADVLATITSPSGKKFNLTLLDTGSDPDVRRDDGVYSRYFTEFLEAGRYAVQVQVTGLGNQTTASYRVTGSAAAYNPGSVQSDGTVVTNPKGPTAVGNQENGITTSDLDPFTRVVSPGGFSYSGAVVDPSVDVLPPGKVIDLKAEQVDNQDLSRGVRLTFSAPGSDYDSGTARAYEIRYSYTSACNLANNFEGGILVTNDMAVQGDILKPKPAGSEEKMVVDLVAVPSDRDALSVWFALRAYDNSSNASPISNIAMMNVFVVPYIEPTTPPATEPVSSAETHTNTTIPTPQPITTTTSTVSVTSTTTTGKSDSDKKLELFQILTVVFVALCVILVCALIATCVVNCRLNQQRKKFQTKMEKRFERQLELETVAARNEHRGIRRPEINLEAGHSNLSYRE